MSPGLPVSCCLAVGRRLSEEAPEESPAPYHSVPLLLRTTPSLLDNSMPETTLPLLDMQPWAAKMSQAPLAECFRTCLQPVWHLQGSTMPPLSTDEYSHQRSESRAVPCGEIESPRQDSAQGATLRTAILHAWPRPWQGIARSDVAADRA